MKLNQNGRFDLVHENIAFLTGVPVAFALVPFIMDLVNGHDSTSDITIKRASAEDDIS